MTPNPERLLFKDERFNHYALDCAPGVTPKPFYRDSRGWIMFGPHDVRSHAKKWQFALVKPKNRKAPRVQVGCRYYTLRQAWAHWGVRKKHQYHTVLCYFKRVPMACCRSGPRRSGLTATS